MNKLNHFTLQTNTYSIRTETFEGSQYMVVPVVMMKEGVHNGSHGAIYHSASELGKFPASWDGIPITISHPQDPEGNFISANSPKVVEKSVGRVFNTNLDGDKLKAEAWLNVKKLKETSPLADAYIRAGKPLDVSVGVFSDEVQDQGEWNGENYVAIATNHRPDHLALLPGEQGACSWSDGCGIRTNSKGGILDNHKETFQLLNNAGYSVLPILVNEQSLQERLDKIRQLLYAQDSETLSFYLMEVYEDYLIYEKNERVNQMHSTRLFKQSYAMMEDGNPSLVGEPIPVVRKVSYSVINSNSKGGSEMTKVEKPCCAEAINSIISSQLTAFTEQDREWLEGQPQEVLEKLVPKPGNANPTQVNQKTALETLRESIKTEQDFIGILPENMQDQFRSGLRLHSAHRQRMINSISTNSKDVFTSEELNAMSTEMLEKLSKMTPAPADYSLNGTQSGIEVNQSGEEPLLPPGVKIS